MKIETKYNVGDTVYYVVYREHEEPAIGKIRSLHANASDVKDCNGIMYQIGNNWDIIAEEDISSTYQGLKSILMKKYDGLIKEGWSWNDLQMVYHFKKPHISKSKEKKEEHDFIETRYRDYK
jgi:hypothetical protein